MGKEATEVLTYILKMLCFLKLENYDLRLGDLQGLSEYVRPYYIKKVFCGFDA